MVPTKHPTWEVQDSSKIQESMECFRRYFFRYVLGFSIKEPSIHLEFGSAVHLAMEHLLLHGYKPESIAEAYMKFHNYYRQFFGELLDDENAPKNPANFQRAIIAYINQWGDVDKNDQVLHTEVAGSALIDVTKPVYFKMDSIIRRQGRGIFSREHKTGRSPSRAWSQGWQQSIQTGLYHHVLHCMFPDENVWGIEINGIFVHNPPRLKKDGTQYAGAHDNEFDRVDVCRSPMQMNDWLTTINFWYDCIQQEFEQLDNCKESDPVMCAFPKNPTSCGSYFGCPYFDTCRAWTNPLQHLDSMPAGCKIEFWDPRDLAKEANKVVNV